MKTKSKLLVILLAATLMLSLMPAMVFGATEIQLSNSDENVIAMPESIETQAEESGVIGGSNRNDELLLGYLDKELDVLTGTEKASESGRLKAKSVSRRSMLGDYEKLVYDELAAQIRAFVDPEEPVETENSVFYVPVKTFLGHELQKTQKYGKSVYAVSVEDWKIIDEIDGLQVIKALTVDMPYELYWFDKTSTFSVSLSPSSYWPGSGNIAAYLEEEPALKFTMKVSKDYSSNGETGTTSFDVSKIQAVKEAVNNAADIITGAQNLSDLNKLERYRDAICQRTSYNEAAARPSTKPPYGDPWQLIYVFDDKVEGDKDETKVVCEGYSKAFQYLFIHTRFNDNSIECYTVTGDMAAGSTTGGHMWNILHMDDGKNYIADITNSDTGTIGNGGGLFISPALEGGSIDAGYSYDVYGSKEADISYIYDEKTTSLFSAEELTMSDSEYSPDKKIDSAEVYFIGTDDQIIAPVKEDIASTVYEDYFYILHTGKTATPKLKMQGTTSYLDDKYYAARYKEVVFNDAANEWQLVNDGEWTNIFPTDPGVYICEIDGITPYYGTKTYLDLIKIEPHIFTATEYVWADEGRSCRAVGKCSECNAEMTKTAVSIKSEVKKAATCTEKGITTYTAEFGDAGLTTQVKDVEDIAINEDNHDYGAWFKDDDYFHKKVCSRSGDHFVTAEHVWNSGETTTEPTETSEGVKTCTCTVCGAKKTETIPTLLESAKAEALAALDEVLKANSYSGAEKNAVEEAVKAAKAKINAAASIAAVNEAKAEADSIISEQKTDAQKEKERKEQEQKQNEQASGNQNQNSSAAPVAAPAPAEFTDLPAVKISKPKAAKKKITVKWKKVSKKNLKKISGIQIQVATDPGFTNIVKTATAGKKKTSKKIGGLQSKTKYYVRIRAYAAGGHVSGWKTKSVKAK